MCAHMMFVYLKLVAMKYVLHNVLIALAVEQIHKFSPENILTNKKLFYLLSQMCMCISLYIHVTH